MGRKVRFHHTLPFMTKQTSQFGCGYLQTVQVTEQCCQPCDFPVKLGLFFCGFAGFFEDLGLLVFWACFWQISVLQIAFFFKFYGTFAVSIYC